MNRYLTLFIKHRQLWPKINAQPVLYYSNMMDKLPTISAQPDSLEIEDIPLRDQKTSRAMKQYLENVNAYKKFLVEEKNEFEIGKRHLANMMGRDPENFTQEDVDESIEYLFPSGLYVKKARPVMKPPEVIYPPKKEAAFDNSGRPYHFLFYTLNPNFYELLHESVKVLNTLYDLEDKINVGNETAEKYSSIETKSIKWLTKNEIESKLTERISDKQYNQLINMFERITEHQYSSSVQDFVSVYTKYLSESIMPLIWKDPVITEDGKKQVEYVGRKKRSIVNVRITYPGTGQFSVDGQDLHYFDSNECREQMV